MKQKKTNEQIEKEKEIASYQKTSFFQKIPYWVKAIFLKYWFYGALFFFVAMGLSLKGENLAVAGGLVGGLVFDFMYGNLLLLMETEPDQHDNFIIYKSKKIYSVIFNILFELAVFFGTAYLCIWFVSLFPTQEGYATNWWFQEPLSMALVALIVDEFILLIKYIIKLIVFKIKEKKRG